MRTYLVIGACGTGKTWVMKQLISSLTLQERKQAGLYRWIENDAVAIIGVYDGTLFEGGDRLSMAVMSDNRLMYNQLKDKIVICEGDRFSNNTFITLFEPIIIKILGNGAEGRKLRGSSQTERHIKSIQTRVDRIQENKRVSSSGEAYDLLMKEIIQPTITKTKSTLF